MVAERKNLVTGKHWNKDKQTKIQNKGNIRHTNSSLPNLRMTKNKFLKPENPTRGAMQSCDTTVDVNER